MRAVATLVPLLFVAALARPATAQPPLEAARGLLAAWHDDPARIDRARVLLEAEAAADPSADTLVELSRAWFLTGDFRTRSEPDRLAAYEQGGRGAKAETLLPRALDLDPHQTGGRLELARLYLGLRRWTDAARELQAVMDETTPTDRPRWAMSDLPRVRAMLVELRERGRVPGIAPQSP